VHRPAATPCVNEQAGVEKPFVNAKQKRRQRSFGLVFLVKPCSSTACSTSETLESRSGMGSGLSSGRPANTQSTSEEAGEKGNSEGHESIQQAARLGPVSANRRLRKSMILVITVEPSTASSHRRMILRANPTLPVGCDIGRTWRDCGRSAGML
jgi:hypothetical protein